LLAGLPQSVPGFALDRMCAGALTAVTAGAGEIALGACDVVVAGGVEHMGHHPMADEVDFNPRFVSERLVDTSAVTMGATAENLHDRFAEITKEDADRYAVRSQQRAAAAWENGVMRETVVPMTVFTDEGWRVANRDEFLRPDTSLEGLAALRTPFRRGGRVTAGNSAGLTDGAIACGHPLAATGVRLMAQLAYGFQERPDVRYGLTGLCVGMGMGAVVVWENLGAGH